MLLNSWLSHLSVRRIAAIALAWWLLIGIAVTQLMPSVASSGVSPLVVPGLVAHIATPSGAPWLIPIDRVTFYEVETPSLDNDEDLIGDMLPRLGWLPVLNGQSVLVLDVDRTAVQVELLEEPNIGGRGWLHLRRLRLEQH